MKKIFKVQGNKSVTENNKCRLALPSRQLNWLDCFAFARNDESRHTEDDSPKYLQTLGSRFFAFHARIKRIRLRLTSSARVAQNDATTCPPLEGGPKSLISRRGKNAMNSNQESSPELDNGETCQGLLRRFVHKNVNDNEISPHNDMNNRIISWIIGGSAGSTQPSLERATLSFRSCQNPQSGMTFIKQSAFTLAESATHVDLSPTKVKFAFTLAEVLITLGIIGIVAAMTIPTLISNYQKKQTVTKLQKAISIFNQAYKMSFDEVGNPSPQEAFDMGPTRYINTYWAPYLKINNICTTYSDCGYDSLTPITLPSGHKDGANIINERTRIGVQTMDGITYIIFTSHWNSNDNDFTTPSNYVWVDLNGGEKPNKYGRDLFMLTRVENKGVFPYGYDLTNDRVNSKCFGSGYTCAEKIRRAGWEIDKSYPW